MVLGGVERPVAQAKVLARIGGLAGLYRIDLDPLYPALSALGGDLARRAMVTVPYTFDRIAVATHASRDRVTAAIDPAQVRRFERLVPGATDIEVELETAGDAIASTLRAPQTRPLDAVCSDLEALGAGSLGLDRLRQTGARLGRAPSSIADRRDADGSLRWTLHFRHDNDGDDERAATQKRLLAVAGALAVTVPQQSIIESLHAVLAKDADSEALLSIGAEHEVPVLAVRWQRVRFETIIRMMLGFYPELDAGRRLGELAGALDANHATAMELRLGQSEPPAMRIAIAL
jgi:hypothetical protein